MKEIITSDPGAFPAGWLPAPPARILDAGCGRGTVALALADAGYAVTAVDIDPDAVAAARAGGVPAIEADIADYHDAPFDAVLFSLSLHHVARLSETVARARALLRPGGTLVVDEFAWESADRATASWFYDAGAVLASAGLLPSFPTTDTPHPTWIRRHRDEQHLHPGTAIVDAIARVFEVQAAVPVPYLYRYLQGWLGEDEVSARVFTMLQHVERLRIADGSLAAVGLRLLSI